MDSLELFLAALIRTSWQASVVCLMVLGVQVIFHSRLSAAWRCGLWALVAARLLLPAAPKTPASIFNGLSAFGHHRAAVARFISSAENAGPVPIGPARSGALDPTVPTNLSHEDPSHPFPVSTSNTAAILNQEGRSRSLFGANARSRLLFAIWLVGVLGLSVYLLGITLRMHRQIARLVPVSDPTLLEQLERSKRQMGLSVSIDLFETEAVHGPALYGFMKPRLLLPSGFSSKFSADEQRWVFLHELAHMRRGDIILNWMVAAFQILHWFNPILWLAAARFRLDRELACDDLAIRSAGEDGAEAYGRTILRLLKNLNQPPVPGLVGILEDKRQLRRRIAAIAEFSSQRRGAKLGALLLVALGLVALTNAQETESQKPLQTHKVALEPPSEIKVSSENKDRSSTLEVRVLTTNREPVGGATIGFSHRSKRFDGVLSGGRLQGPLRGSSVILSDDLGRFWWPSPPEDGILFVACRQGFAVVSVESVRTNGFLVLQPFGRIEGTSKIAGEWAAGQKLTLGGFEFQQDGLRGHFEATVDEQGRFSFAQVPPGKCSIVRMVKMTEHYWSAGQATEVLVEPGATARVRLGESGARIRAQVRFDLSWNPGTAPILKAELQATGPVKGWGVQPMESYLAAVQPDGSVFFDSVSPGSYAFFVSAVNLNDLGILGEATVNVTEPVYDNPIIIPEVVVKPAIK